MRVAVPRKSLKRILRWSQVAWLTAAAGLLGYCAFVLTDTWIYQRQASRTFDQLHPRPALPPGPGVAAVGGLMGRMEIPRLGMTVVVAEGTAGATLRRAGGHIRGTGLPGHSGNIGIAGHRDTLFRPLQNIRRDDVIMLTTLQGEYRYRVVSTKIVRPSDVEVLSSDGHEILTLVTCYPFYFVGPSPDRFIVRAERVTGRT
jgi:sortase A